MSDGSQSWRSKVYMSRQRFLEAPKLISCPFSIDVKVWTRPSQKISLNAPGSSVPFVYFSVYNMKFPKASCII